MRPRWTGEMAECEPTKISVLQVLPGATVSGLADVTVGEIRYT